ncbi:MAG TPA: hypothetical protein VEA99_06230 [Gemmatimonadaceae bacterium]|nr:hypothetical protein [Gemmatimonadaceae bacterium]
MTVQGLVTGLLADRGFPAAVELDGHLLPAAVVWVDDPADRALQLLPRLFGGALLLEMRDHHGEPTPAFWIGIGRPAALAASVIAASMDRTREGTLLGPVASEAWALLDQVATGDHDDAARDPAARLEQLVADSLPIAPHITSGLMLALASHWRSPSRAVELVLPSRRDRARWADAFLRAATAPPM